MLPGDFKNITTNPIKFHLNFSHRFTKFIFIPQFIQPFNQFYCLENGQSSDIENTKEHFADEGSEEEEEIITSRKHYSDDEEDEEEEEEDEGPVSTKSTIDF